MNELQSLIEELRKRGAQPYWNRRRQLAVGWSKPVLPDAVCFWVAFEQGHWFLGTWGGRTYRLEQTASMADVCMSLLDSGEMHILAEIPPEMAVRHALRMLSEAEEDALWEQIYRSAESEPPEVAYDFFVAQFRARKFVVNENGGRSVSVEPPPDDVRNSRRLWFTVYNNHWYVKMPDGSIYGLCDTDVIEFCHEALMQDYPKTEPFFSNLIEAYGLFEVSEESKHAIEKNACFVE